MTVCAGSHVKAAPVILYREKNLFPFESEIHTSLSAAGVTDRVTETLLEHQVDLPAGVTIRRAIAGLRGSKRQRNPARATHVFGESAHAVNEIVDSVLRRVDR